MHRGRANFHVLAGQGGLALFCILILSDRSPFTNYPVFFIFRTGVIRGCVGGSVMSQSRVALDLLRRSVIQSSTSQMSNYHGTLCQPPSYEWDQTILRRDSSRVLIFFVALSLQIIRNITFKKVFMLYYGLNFWTFKAFLVLYIHFHNKT